MKYQRTNKHFALFFALKIMQEINERYNELYSEYVFEDSLIEQFNELIETSNVDISVTDMTVILCRYNNHEPNGVLFFHSSKDGWSLKFTNCLDILAWCSEFTIALDASGGIIGLDEDVSASRMRETLIDFTAYLNDCYILYYKSAEGIYINRLNPLSIDNDKDNLEMESTETFLSDTLNAKCGAYMYVNEMSDKTVYEIPPPDIRILSIGGLYRFSPSGPIHFSEPHSEKTLFCFKEFQWLYIYYSDYKLEYCKDSFFIKSRHIETTFYYRIKGDFYDSLCWEGNFLLAIKTENSISVYDHEKKQILSNLSECYLIEEGAVLYRAKEDDYLKLLPPQCSDVSPSFKEEIGLNNTDLRTCKKCIKINENALILQKGDDIGDIKVIGSDRSKYHVQQLKVKLPQKETFLFIINGEYILTDDNIRISLSLDNYYLYTELISLSAHTRYEPSIVLEEVYYNKYTMSISFVFFFYLIEIDAISHGELSTSLCRCFITNFNGENIYETDDSRNIIKELKKLGFSNTDIIHR